MSVQTQKSASKDEVAQMFKAIKPFIIITTSKERRAEEIFAFTPERVAKEIDNVTLKLQNATTKEEKLQVREIVMAFGEESTHEINKNSSFKILTARMMAIQKYTKGLEAIDAELGNHLNMESSERNPLEKMVMLKDAIDPNYNQVARKAAACYRELANEIEAAADRLYNNDKVKSTLEMSLDVSKSLKIRSISKDQTGSKLDEQETLKFIGEGTTMNGEAVRSIKEHIEKFEKNAEEFMKEWLEVLVDAEDE